ncbi:MAG: carbon-nitrogen hydrolase family protein [Bacteroidetes bacterium]|nr:carbon-nitrogen hydrolase family protein [Bacteroidota bacterium]
MKRIEYRKLLWFFIGFGLFFFTRTSTFIPIAIALGPIFILRLSSSQKPFKGILITLLGFILVMQIAFWTPINFNDLFPGIFSFVRSLLLGSIFTLPFIANRLIQPKFTGFFSTLVFPVCAVALYYLESVYGPFDGVIIFYAYTQYGNLPLTQLLSIAGPWTLIFLISWFSSIVCWAWENDFNLEKTKKGIVIFLCMAIGLFLYGGIKVSPYNFDYKGKTVRIAAAVFQKNPGEPTHGIDKILNERLFTPLQETLKKIENATKQAALTNSKIIVFQEFSLIIPEEQEKEAISELKRMAKENDIYICIGYVSMPKLLEGEHKVFMGYMELSDEEEEGKNIALFINNLGEIEAEYQKHNLVFGEGTWVLEGPGIIPVVETPFGRIGIVICRDMEFSDYMMQTGKQNADIVLAPSYEAVKSLSITYAQMLRSIENGFSFVRACGYGLSIAVDYNGKILSSMNYFTTQNTIMYTDVPTKGIRTIYSFIGDLFAWLCVTGFIGYIAAAIISRVRKKITK